MRSPASLRSYRLELDLPPRERWAAVITDHREPLARLLAELRASCADGDEDRSAFLGQVAGALALQLRTGGGAYLVEELEGVAATAGLPFHDVVFANLCYESSVACTAILARSGPQYGGAEAGPLLLGRTLDWDLEASLRDLTINVTFCRRGRPIFEATTFAGFVGAFTAMRPGWAAVAINYRPPPEEDAPLPADVSTSWPVGLLVRHVLQQQDAHHEEGEVGCSNESKLCAGTAAGGFARVRRALSETPLWAPCFICIAGATRREQAGKTKEDACILARSELTVDDMVTLGTEGPWPMLVQGNADRGTPRDADEDSFERTKLVRTRWSAAVAATATAAAGGDEAPRSGIDIMWDLLSASPVNSSETVFGTVCSPGMLREAGAGAGAGVGAGQEVLHKGVALPCHQGAHFESRFLAKPENEPDKKNIAGARRCLLRLARCLYRCCCCCCCCCRRASAAA